MASFIELHSLLKNVHYEEIIDIIHVILNSFFLWYWDPTRNIDQISFYLLLFMNLNEPHHHQISIRYQRLYLRWLCFKARTSNKVKFDKWVNNHNIVIQTLKVTLGQFRTNEATSAIKNLFHLIDLLHICLIY